jgi:hypothetical protein
MPFGGGEIRGESHTPHGETATAKWTFVSAATAGKVRELTLVMNVRVRPGRVTKRLSLVDGHNTVYVRHTLEGFSGRMPLGHHATLAMPETPGSVLLATSAIRFGMTPPAAPGNPAVGEYHSIALGKRFAKLSQVPLRFRDESTGDFSAFPARRGYCDIISVFHRPAAAPAWTAATFAREGFLWFSLKDPRVLPALVMWVENHGRHIAPWNGRNNCLGLEDVCAFFAMGLAPSLAKNVLNRAGVPTALELSPKRPTAIHYIEGVAKTPAGFGRVRNATFSPGKVCFTDERGRRVVVKVCHEFLRGGELPCD